MKYYIIAGEASGDLHASKLMNGIKVRDPEAEFRCWGGTLMEQAGGTIVKHYRDLAFMGFHRLRPAGEQDVPAAVDFQKRDQDGCPGQAFARR